jgi:uncharacterized protein YjdB
VTGPETLGTEGESLRLEAFYIELTDAPADMHIMYRVQVQNKGWMDWAEDGAIAGTTGEGLQVETVEIKLVDDNGDAYPGYSVEYQGHVQNKGDMPADESWYVDGEQLGTVGEFLRLEALRVQIVKDAADMTAYNAAVATANGLTESDYTTASWAALQTALEENVVTEDNTQDEVDAATAAINDAMDALVMVTNVTGVEATDAKTLTVTFNTAISAEDQALITFDVKRGTTTTTMLDPVWAEDGMSVEISRATNLVGGTYTVTASGIDFGIDSATAVVEAQAATTLEITTSRVNAAAAQSIGYVVTDQYGDEMTVSAALLTFTTSNLTDATRTVTGTSLSNLSFAATNIDDVVRVTAYVSSNPSVKAVKDITVSNITLGEVTFGTPVLPEGSTRFQTTLAGVVIPVTAVDNFGAEMDLTAGAWTTATATADGLYPVFAASSFTSVVVNADGDLVVTLGTPGTATLTVTNPSTGAVDVITIEVVAAPDTATITLSQPEDTIRVGTAEVIPFTILDQYGDEQTVPFTGWATADVSLASSNPAVATVAWSGNEITVTPITTGSTTIFANVVTPFSTGADSIVISVDEAKAPEVVTVSGTPKTSLAQGETVLSTAETGALAFDIVDQDGEPINLIASGSAGVKANLTVTDTSDVLLNTAPAAAVLMAANMSATTGTTNPITVTANATNGTATVKVQLFNDADSDDTMDPGEEMESVAEVVYTVSSQALTSGSFTNMTNATLNADGDAAYADPTAAASVVTYSLLDQAGNALTTTTATNVTWTVINNGTTAISVNDGTAKTLAAGATGTYTTVAAAGASANTTLTIDATAAQTVTVKAAASGVTATELEVYYYHTLFAIGAPSTTFTGTVVALDTTANWVILHTAVGNVVVDYTLGGAQTYTVDGSTATLAIFEDEDNLSIGDSMTASQDATDGTYALTNN